MLKKLQKFRSSEFGGKRRFDFRHRFFRPSPNLRVPSRAAPDTQPANVDFEQTGFGSDSHSGKQARSNRSADR